MSIYLCQEFSKGVRARNSAAYVGRVGGLAVALGIGTAVFTGHGVALADSADGASGPASNESSETKSDTSNEPPAAQTEATMPDPTGRPGSFWIPARHRPFNGGRGIVHSSGAAQRDNNSSTGGSTTSDDPPASAKDGSTTEPVDTEPPGSGLPTGTPATGQPAADQTDSSKPAWKGTRHSIFTFGEPSQGDNKPTREVDARPPASETNGSDNNVQGPPDNAIPNTSAEAEAVATDLVRNSASTVATLSVSNSQAVVDQPEEEPPATETAPHVVTGLLAAVGLGPVTTGGPLAPAAPPAPTLFDALQMAWREISRTFFNQSPTIVYDPAGNSLVDGSVVGKVTAADTDSTLALTASKPAHGEVTVDEDGTFTYTPDATYDGRDSFTITASEADAGFHIHGLAGLINLVTFGLIGDSGHTASTTITIGAVGGGGGYTSSTVVSGLEEPTDFRFLPDGRILFAEKGGAIKVSGKDGQLQSAPLTTLPTSTDWARGLAGIEVDPDFQTNGYVYVSYVRADNYERLSRLTVTDPTAEVLTIDPDSEVVLVQGTQQAGDDHHGGGLSFGPDGKLYWSVGDNVCCSVIDGSNSQDLSNIYGKVLRLNPDGTAPTDNPFYDGGGPNYDGIYATGFRNPFRLSFTPDGKLLVADVGQSEWEEVNLVTAGANYGWPNAEGPCNGIGTASCSTPSSYDNPIYAYRHTSGGNSITAVTGYTGSSSGNGENTVLIADFNQGWVKVLTFNSDYSALISETLFDVAAPGNTNKLAQGPDGAIYQLTFDGKLTRIGPTSDQLSSV
jgi:VCBS repeat-containing protein